MHGIVGAFTALHDRGSIEAGLTFLGDGGTKPQHCQRHFLKLRNLLLCCCFGLNAICICVRTCIFAAIILQHQREAHRCRQHCNPAYPSSKHSLPVMAQVALRQAWLARSQGSRPPTSRAPPISPATECLLGLPVKLIGYDENRFLPEQLQLGSCQALTEVAVYGNSSLGAG